MPFPISRLVRSMEEASLWSETGPMSAVAGAMAQEMVWFLRDRFGSGEALVENGGDLFVHCHSPLRIAIHAGTSPLSDKLALEVPAGEWGICTSSGTLGHSYSAGKADACTVVCADGARADAWATALANQVQEEEDVEKVLEASSRVPEIVSCVILKGGKIGARGRFPLAVL
ncbi:MAG: UPF0280 family protein [Bacteroidales bacterium]